MSKYNFKSIAPIIQRSTQNVVKNGSIIFVENNQLPKPGESPSTTPSITPTITPSISITATPSITPTVTSTPSITPTITPSISISITPSVTVTPSITPTVTITPTITPSVTITPTPSITPTTPSVVQVLNKLYYGVNSSAACANVVTLADFAYVYMPVGANPFLTNRPWYTDSSLTTPYPDGYYALHDIFNGYDGYYAQISGGVVSQSGICPSPSPTPSVTPTITPSVTPTITPTVTPSITITPSKTPSVTPTVTPTITPSISVTPSLTPSISITPSVTPSSVSGVTFSQAFTQGVAPTTTIETAWNTFRASLTGTYTQFVWSSTNGNSITVSHPTLVQTLANALKNATNNTSVTINSVIWRVGTGCGTPKIGGVAVEFSNIASCSVSSTYALRPMINNSNWGGTNQYTVNAASQTITLTFS